MKTFPSLIAAVMLLSAISCKKNEIVETPTSNEEVSESVAAKISALGLTSKGAYKTEGGYIAEGDIFLDDEMLNSAPEQKSLIVADVEHYRTTNLVGGLPRVLRVRYTGATVSVSNAINAAINRYNALNLRIRFVRVNVAPFHITVSNVSGVGYIASAGFPVGGNPHNLIRFNVAYAGWNANTLTTVMAHELGHCIGMRHTDLACRQFSCGGAPVNEGWAGVGAHHIPGTPVPCNADPTSWMLACIGNGVNRPFNFNDRVALNWLY